MTLGKTQGTLLAFTGTVIACMTEEMYIPDDYIDAARAAAAAVNTGKCDSNALKMTIFSMENTQTQSLVNFLHNLSDADAKVLRNIIGNLFE